MKKKSDNFGLGFTLKKSVTTPQGQTQTVELEVDPDKIDSELDALKKTGLIEDAKELIRFAEAHGIDLSDTDDSPANNIVQTRPTTLLLSDLIAKYCEDCIAERNWSPTTETQNRQSLDILLFLIGDRSCESIDRPTAKEVREKLKHYPKNKNKLKKFNGLTIEQIMVMEDIDPISARTINKHLTLYSSLFGWGKREKLVSDNPFENISVRDSEAPEEKRLPFDNEDLKKIFSSTLYTAHDFKEAYRYWTPLIALFSGARLNEIAQLEVADIHKIDDIYVFDINTEPNDSKNTKRTKNTQSIRQIPIHSKLIEFGLIEYRDRLEKQGETRLFPELTLDSRGSYSRKISDWFNPSYLPSLKIDTTKKKFHCFRSTLANELEDVGTSHELIQQLTGHKTSKSILQKHYLKPNKARLLKQWLEKAGFGHALQDVKKFNSQ